MAAFPMYCHMVYRDYEQLFATAWAPTGWTYIFHISSYTAAARRSGHGVGRAFAGYFKDLHFLSCSVWSRKEFRLFTWT